jgi:hypothetical protein
MEVVEGCKITSGEPQFSVILLLLEKVGLLSICQCPGLFITEPREPSMEMSFFALPSKQGPVQGRFKPAHRPISLSTKVAACVRRFGTPTPLNHGRPALAHSFKSSVGLREYLTSQLSLLMPYEPGLGQGQSKKRHLHARLKINFKEAKCYNSLKVFRCP